MTVLSPFEYAARQFQAKAPDPYLRDPVGWAEHRLGVHLWSKQREIAESVMAWALDAQRVGSCDA